MGIEGNRYGRLTVIEISREEQRLGVTGYWVCRCDCGNKKVVRRGNLTSGNTRSCGCARSHQGDLTGKRFGRLVVIKLLLRGFWECRCDCGNKTSVARSSLVTKNTRSCGCLRKDVRRALRIEIKGKRFGKLLCVKLVRRRKGHDYYLFRCDCGKERVFGKSYVMHRHIKSCGCDKNERHPWK